MGNLLGLIASLFTGYLGYREEIRAGRWNTSKFLAALSFVVLEAVLVLAPLALPLNSPSFLPVLLGCYALALLNFVWFVPLMRRWKTSPASARRSIVPSGSQQP